MQEALDAENCLLMTNDANELDCRVLVGRTSNGLGGVAKLVGGGWC